MLTYCMNVHPGETLEEQTGNIERLAVAVTKRYRALCGLDESYMCGLGLRFGAPARVSRFFRFNSPFFYEGIKIVVFCL